MGIVLYLSISTALFAVAVIAGSDWLIAITNLVIGVELERCGPPAGVISITLGLLLLLASLSGRLRRRKGTTAAGAKSRALRDALVRRMQDHAFPVPA